MTPHAELLDLDQDRLQGWQAPWTRDLRTPHRTPALVELALLRDNKPSGRVFSIRGPAVTVGRYSPETGPVDIDLGVLDEHERMRIGLPHVRIGRDLDGWWIEPMTMFYPTELDGKVLEPSGGELKDGSTLTLGDVSFAVTFNPQADKAPPGERPLPPCLRLKREGSWTGISIPLDSQSVVCGRSSPQTGAVGCDLSALPDAERVHLGWHHARFFIRQSRWYVEPMGRAPIFINRQSALDRLHGLMTGDEVALGNLLFTFLDAALASDTLDEGMESGG